MKLKELLKVIYNAQLVSIRVRCDDEVIVATSPNYVDSIDLPQIVKKGHLQSIEDLRVKEVLQVRDSIVIYCEV